MRRYLEKAGRIPIDQIEREEGGKVRRGSKIVPSRVREKARAKSRKFELILSFPSGRYN